MPLLWTVKFRGRSPELQVPYPKSYTQLLSLMKVYQKWKKVLASTGEGLTEEEGVNFANKMGES